MFIERSRLIQESIEHLELLSVLLADEVRPDFGKPIQLSEEKLTSKEALMSISVLLPKLRAVRQVDVLPIRARPVCLNCED